MSLALKEWVRFFLRKKWLAPSVTIDKVVAKRMLAVAQAGPADRLVDLGCGEGRILATALKRPFNVAKAVGYELDEDLAKGTRAKLAQLAAQGQVAEVRQKDLLQAGDDLADATIATMYLSNKGNRSVAQMLVRDFFLARAGPRRKVLVSFHFEWAGAADGGEDLPDGVEYELDKQLGVPIHVYKKV